MSVNLHNPKCSLFKSIVCELELFLFHVNLKRCISLIFFPTIHTLYTKDISYYICISTKHTILIVLISSNILSMHRVQTQQSLVSATPRCQSYITEHTYCCTYQKQTKHSSLTYPTQQTCKHYLNNSVLPQTN